ncbi:MAG: phosphonoacetaldehyde hydrolase [Rhodospirillales bacterium]|nr:phosphonoacetaldehyde hydrolase [Rhodospirillales bacterium]MDH3790605.1 phosphonoacetaldehyde hydrolase [Rhodospirillales bacterium]MDH3912050.1 phosphonoacetaldehyde hydrolase [Rhodospirillales bacterium]MDH3969688.1 phosphonoacetaldehyde hydrolase [Rhodospirillales bacterium]
MSLRSDYVYSRSYRGKVKGIVLDWSGTTADAYVLAPAVVFVDVFKKHGVEISMLEARGPMGLRKDLHIKALTEVPEIRERWKAVHGKDPDQGDIDRMFADFVPMQLECLRQYTSLLPGVAETTQKLQKDYGIKIGSSTGFVRSMVDILEEDAKKQGYTPDASVAGDEVEHGARPKPFMVYRNLDMMDVHPIQSVVKVDDTISGIGEALEAGCWGVGIARYSNYMNVNSLDEAESLPDEEMRRRLALTREILRKAGAHYVIDEFTQLPEVIDDVNERLARGEKP